MIRGRLKPDKSFAFINQWLDDIELDGGTIDGARDLELAQVVRMIANVNIPKYTPSRLHRMLHPRWNRRG